MYACTIAYAVYTLIICQVDTETASARARAALALAAADTESVAPVPPKPDPVVPEPDKPSDEFSRRQSENYTRMYDLALKENRILVVHVGEGREDLANEFDDCYHANVKTFPGVVGKGIVIARSIAGRMMKIAAFPFTATLDAIKGVIGVRQSAVPFAYGGSSRATQAYSPPMTQMTQMPMMSAPTRYAQSAMRYAAPMRMSGGSCGPG